MMGGHLMYIAGGMISLCLLYMCVGICRTKIQERRERQDAFQHVSSLAPPALMQHVGLDSSDGVFAALPQDEEEGELQEGELQL